MIENILTLLMLVLLQAVLGLDNLLYISLESQRVAKDKQAFVRKMGIAVAMVLRIALLFILISVIDYFQDPFLKFNIPDILSAKMNVHSLIVLIGGVFILYTATKEIIHMLSLEEADHGEKKEASVNTIIFWIVLMNIVFSFDSILSAMALTKVFWVMATAIIIGGLLMIWLSGTVSSFLQKNRMYEVLGLFILFIVGIMLLTEGGHLAHIYIFGNKITPMSKTTFYFVIAVLIIIDVVQSKYQKKLQARKLAKSQAEEKSDS
ncbi:MAG: tellurium resistance protein TerC [Flammeovirgaceae bacterium]|nr:tellurium resistance protein TerC [Flammeovirgaceae bacterium]